jgi:hypothetical protein
MMIVRDGARREGLSGRKRLLVLGYLTFMLWPYILAPCFLRYYVFGDQSDLMHSPLVFKCVSCVRTNPLRFTHGLPGESHSRTVFTW